jgi:23S rRNA pseudouridine955/2504/2580 synthase
MTRLFTAGIDDDGRRLDRLLRRLYPALPLSLLYRLLRQGRVSLDGRRAGAASRVSAGALIRVAGDLGDAADSAGGQTPAPDSALGFVILREAEGLLFVNKAAGAAVHGPGSLETLVRAYLAPKLPPSLGFRPGPLHRLDRPTSGVLTFGASLEGARRFSALIREGRVGKTYLALVEGRVDRPLIWEDPLYRDREARKTRAAEAGEEAKPARTRVFPLGQGGGCSLVRLEIETGRTHQIRAQGALHGHPLAGDRKYGGGFTPGGLLLHALSLSFPAGEGQGAIRVGAPLPGAFRRRIRSLLGEEAGEELIRGIENFGFSRVSG